MEVNNAQIERLTDEAGRIANLAATIACSATLDAERGDTCDCSGALFILMERTRGYCKMLAEIQGCEVSA